MYKNALKNATGYIPDTSNPNLSPIQPLIAESKDALPGDA
jgi:hypothetical protein